MFIDIQSHCACFLLTSAAQNTKQEDDHARIFCIHDLQFAEICNLPKIFSAQKQQKGILQPHKRKIAQLY